jgi:hypothetical protein
MTSPLEAVASLGLGLGLAAACGFRVFVPLLVVSLGARLGYVPLAPGWEWMASVPATVAFGSATALEILGYYIPWLDHVLDIIPTPAAVGAGIVISASVFGDMPPLLKWTAVIIGGGGIAALTQGSTVALRAASGATTGGLGNPIVATVELAGSLLTALAAIAAPLVAAAAVLLVLFAGFRIVRRRRGARLTRASRARGA